VREGKRSDENARHAGASDAAGQAAPWAVGSSWMRLPGPMATYAYAWALANVEYIVQTKAWGISSGFWNRLGTGTFDGTSAARVVHDITAICQATAEY